MERKYIKIKLLHKLHCEDRKEWIETSFLKYGVFAKIMQEVGSCSKLRCEHQDSKRMVIFLMSIWNNEWKGNMSHSQMFQKVESG